MDTPAINHFLACVGSQIAKSQSREGWVVATCPFGPWKHSKGVDRNPSFGVRISPYRLSVYHCFSCGSGGRLQDLVWELVRYTGGKKSRGFSLSEAVLLCDQEEAAAHLDIPDYVDDHPPVLDVVPWDDYYLSEYPLAENSDRAQGYLDARKVPLHISRFLDLRYDPHRDRVCFPIRNWDHLLCGFHGRRLYPGKGPKYFVYRHNQQHNKLVWYGEDWLDVEHTVLLVESVFDLTSVLRVYSNAACSLSAGLGRGKVLRMGSAMNIVTLYDHGEGGDAARSALNKYLPDSCIRHLIPTPKQGDPGGMTVGELHDCLVPYLSLT